MINKGPPWSKRFVNNNLSNIDDDALLAQFAQSSEAEVMEFNLFGVSTQQVEAIGIEKDVTMCSEKLNLRSCWSILWRWLILGMVRLILDMWEVVIVKVTILVMEMTTSGMTTETRKVTSLKKATVVMSREDKKAPGVQKPTVDMAINCKKPDWYKKTAVKMATRASSTVRLMKDTIKMILLFLPV